MSSRFPGTIVVALLIATTGGVAAVLGPEVAFDSEQRYLLLATKRTSTMQSEINQAAAHGFRVVRGTYLGGEVAFVMERFVESQPEVDYLLLATKRVSTMEREMNEAARRGFRLLPETVMSQDCDELVLLMERQPQSPESFEYVLAATRRTSTLQKEISQAAEAGFDLVGLIEGPEYVALMEQVRSP